MIKVSVMYPNDGSDFDMDYYLDTHMPMVKSKVGDACKQMAVEGGIGGGSPGEAAAFTAMGHLYFDSVEAFQQAFGPHADAIMADIPNYTSIQPQILISEVKL